MTGTMAMADQILTIMEDGIVEAAMMDGIMEEVTRDLNLMDQMLRDCWCHNWSHCGGSYHKCRRHCMEEKV